MLVRDVVSFARRRLAAALWRELSGKQKESVHVTDYIESSADTYPAQSTTPVAVASNVRWQIRRQTVLAHQMLQAAIVVVPLDAHVAPVPTTAIVAAARVAVPVRTALGSSARPAVAWMAGHVAAACGVRNLWGQPVGREDVANLVVVLAGGRGRPRLHQAGVVGGLLLEWLQRDKNGDG